MTLFLNQNVTRDIKSKKKIEDNRLHNIFRLFDNLANFPFHSSQRKR